MAQRAGTAAAMNPAPDAPWNDPWVDRLVAAALEEDIGHGDITSRAVVPPGVQAVGRIRAKEPLVVAGLGVLARVFDRLGEVAVRLLVAEGSAVGRDAVVAEARGDAHALLAGERVVLNFLQHLSGIATLTRRCIEEMAGGRCVLRDTRKTLPGLRALEKYAVRTGGGTSHRLGLDDGVLIKDSHIALAGGVPAAVRAARARLGGREIEVECATLAEVEAALGAGADVILLDNMPDAEMARAASIARGRARTEASGGITAGRVRAVAALGVDFIAMGSLTHSAPAVDLCMDVSPQ